MRKILTVNNASNGLIAFVAYELFFCQTRSQSLTNGFLKGNEALAQF